MKYNMLFSHRNFNTCNCVISQITTSILTLLIISLTMHYCLPDSDSSLMTGPGVSKRMWPIWVTGMVAAAVVVVVVLVVVLVTDVLLRDIMWLSCCCCDELVKESVNVFRRSINWGFDPDTGRLLFLSSAFRSLTVKQKMSNKHQVQADLNHWPSSTGTVTEQMQQKCCILFTFPNLFSMAWYPKGLLFIRFFYPECGIQLTWCTESVLWE